MRRLADFFPPQSRMLARATSFLRRHFHGEELVAISFVVGLFTLGAVVRIYRVLYHTTPATLNAERGAAAKASP